MADGGVTPGLLYDEDAAALDGAHQQMTHQPYQRPAVVDAFYGGLAQRLAAVDTALTPLDASPQRGGETLADYLYRATPPVAADVALGMGPGSLGGAGVIRQVGRGPFGTMFTADSWLEALGELLRRREGEIVGQVSHPATGPIGVPWGKPGTGRDDGYGMSKIYAFHPEVARDLPDIIQQMQVVRASPNRVKLDDASHEAAASLNWLGDPKTWLLTAYGKNKPTVP